MDGLAAVRAFIAITVLIAGLYAMKFEKFERDPSKDVLTCRRQNRVFYYKDCCRSVSQCLAICAKDAHCDMVYYDELLRDCFGCEGEVLLKLKKPVNRTVHFYRRIKSSINLPCSDSMACGRNQICQLSSRICTCRPGYSYSPTMSTCNRDCLRYGGTYQIYQDMRMNISHIAEHFVNSRTECMDYCTMNSQCRSFNFKASVCDLNNVTALTNPMEFVSSISLDYFHRDCL